MFTRRSRLLTAVGAVTVSLMLALPGTAGANDGRASDPVSEIQAVYHHAQNRQPTADELKRAKRVIDDNCETGVLEVSYDVMTSPRTTGRWSNPQDLAGALYAGFLNRGPDATGLRTYTNAVRDRGFNWAAGDILGSNEYRNRLRAICDVPTNEELDAGMYGAEAARAYIRRELISEGKGHLLQCELGRVLRSSTDALLVEGRLGGKFVSKVTEITNYVHEQTDDRTCRAGATTLEAAAQAVRIIDAGRGNNPVYMTEEEHYKPFSLATEFELRIGQSPLSYDTYKGRYSSGYGQLPGDS